MMQNDMGRGQGGVSAKVHFKVGGEPSQMESLRLGHQKSRFCHSIFLGNGQQNVFFQPIVQKHHTGGIALEDFVGESVHLVKGNVHAWKVHPSLIFIAFGVLLDDEDYS